MSKHPLDLSLELAIQGSHEESQRILEDYVKENPNDPGGQFNMGWYRCYEGRWKEASILLDYGRWISCFGSPALKNNKPIWREEPLQGKTVHLRLEGGYGDEIINVRWAKYLSELGAKVIVSCSPSLANLFSRIKEVTAITHFGGADHVHCDYWIPAMSGMNWFDPSVPPYLTTDPALTASMKKLVSSRRMKIGLRWAGSPEFEHQQHRKFDPHLMLGLVNKFPEFDFYSLQRDNDLVDDLPEGTIDLQSIMKTWDDTASIIENLDLVITSCTSIAHLAGALGKPTWVITPVLSYYCWAIPGKTTPWYDSVRLFRQKTYGEWSEPFKEISCELESFVRDNKENRKVA